MRYQLVAYPVIIKPILDQYENNNIILTSKNLIRFHKTLRRYDRKAYVEWLGNKKFPEFIDNITN